MEQVKQQLELKVGVTQMFEEVYTVPVDNTCTCMQVDELQSSMKKQEKSWQRKLQKVSTSYQDQIDGVSSPLCTVGFTSSQVGSRQSMQKLSVLEQTLQKDKTQSSLEKQLSSLKKVIFYCLV